MMQKAKKVCSLVLAFLLAVSAFSGCATSPEEPGTSDPVSNSTDPAGTGSEADPHAEHYEISIASWDLDYLVDASNPDPAYQELQDKFNITIKTMNTTWDDYIQKIQTWAASGSMPDISAIDAMGQPFYSTWVEEGIIKQIPNDLSAYPSLKAIMDMADTEAYRDADGNFYCVPRPYYADNALWGMEKGILIRIDWLQAAGIDELPTSMDELVAGLKAAMALPEAETASVGITALNKAFLFVLMLSYAPEVACGMNYWVKADDGSYIPGIFTEGTKTGLLEMNKLYKEGVLDNDIPILKGTEGTDKFLSGRAVAYCNGSYKDADWRSQWTELNPDKDYDECVAYIHPWPAADGNTYRMTSMSHWSESYFNGDMPEDKYQRVLEFYDYLLSDEGLTLMRFGVEGEDYTRDGDTITVTRPVNPETNDFVPLVDLHPEINNLKNVVTWDGDFMLVNPATNAESLKVLNEEADWYRENTVPCDTDFGLTFLEYENKDRTLSDPTDELIKVVMSDNAEQAYEDMVTSLRANGYDAAIASFNEAAKAIGK